MKKVWEPNLRRTGRGELCPFRAVLGLVTAAFLAALCVSASPRTPEKLREKVRKYFIAAEEVQWDYAPRGRDLSGIPPGWSREDETGPVTVALPMVVHKAIFREYTDDSFRTLKLRSSGWEHLGILGPLIRAEVGDTIRVVFLNRTHILCNLHPHGLSYDKANEGSLYEDGTAGADKRDDAIRPGERYTYTWTVPERAGPGPGDPSSIAWMYHSHYVEQREVNTGLVGPIIVTARGMALPDGAPKDVDREFFTAFLIFDETQSMFVDSLAPGVKPPPHIEGRNPANESFLRYTINGMVEGNLPGLEMRQGEHVRWYLMAGTNENDVHTAHWHGLTAIVMHSRSDMVPLLPMSTAVADLVPDRVGTWLFHCHVADHLAGGMNALFTVLPPARPSGATPSPGGAGR